MYVYDDLRLFFSEGATEIMRYAIYLIIILGIVYLCRKCISPLRYFVVGITVISAMAYLLLESVKMEAMISVMFAMLLVIIISIFNVPEYKVYEKILMFTAFLVPQRLFNSSYSIWGYGVFYLMIWCVLALFEKGKNIQNKVLCRYVMFTYLALCAFIYRRIENHINFAYRGSFVIGTVGFLILEILLVTLIVLLSLLLKKKFWKQLQILEVIDRKYPDTRKWSILFEIFTMMILIVLPIPFVLTGTVSYVLQNSLAIFDIAILVLQIVYMVFVYQITEYKHTMRDMEHWKKQEEDYYSSLDKNLEQMKDLRHDIKNIFLTMSNFVERSNDEEMKRFYSEKIYPFALEEIEQNYLFAQIYQIPSEELRAFLYMKFFQAIQRKINIKVSVHIEETAFQYGMELVDLTRILGILLDNSIEECESQEKAFLEMTIRAKEGMVAYSIKNTIRTGHKFEHLLAGKSDKDGHGGRGLKIIKKIVETYPEVSLNTYFDESWFQQNLNIVL